MGRKSRRTYDLDSFGGYLSQIGMSEAELARRIGKTPGLINQWVKGLKQIPAAQCVAIERATDGRIRRVDLRPDLFGPLTGT